MRILAIISRIFVGIVFVFSGFVKAIDPWGSAYKFTDYFLAFNLPYFERFSLSLSILQSALEFAIGVALVFGIKSKISNWGSLLFMAFFTPLTLYLALANPVSDCGCFGDAIILSNWHTFYKNLIILVFTLIAFLYRKKFKPLFNCKIEWTIWVIFFLLSVGISNYCLRYLPLIDFLAWKEGNSMKIDKSIKEKFFVTYKNKQTGETQEYLSPNYPWNDSVWIANWEFVSQRVESQGRPQNLIHIIDEFGTDISNEITQNENFQFVLIVNSIEHTKLRSYPALNELAREAAKNGIDFAALSGSTPEETQVFSEKIKAEFPFYYSDEVVLKTVVRSNPGLMLLKDGMILKKWGYAEIPVFSKIDFTKLEAKYFKK